MKTYEELEALWQATRPAPIGRGVVRGICLRLGGGRHELAERAEISLDGGVVGDRWSASDDPERLSQVTIMNAAVAEHIAHGVTPGHSAGDNFYVELDVSERALPIGSRLRLGSALLEVTAEPHLGCRKFNQRFGAGALRWVNHAQNRQLRLRGVNLRVLAAGSVHVGDTVAVVTE